MKTRILLRSRWATIAVGIYLLLWILTATIGSQTLENQFNEQLRYGYDLSGKKVEIARIERFYFKDLMDPRNTNLFPPDGRFRYRSHGIAITPFLIIDDIATVFAPMGGLGAKRMNFWFFGYTKSWLLKRYWAV